MNRWHDRVALRARYRCEYCRAPELVFNFFFEVEHIVPLSQYGKDLSSNLALACRSCNLYKGSTLYHLDPEIGFMEQLFNPRRDKWHIHFNVDPEIGIIVGKTPVGRATIACLRINSTTQLTARRQWMRLGIFP